MSRIPSSRLVLGVAADRMGPAQGEACAYPRLVTDDAEFRNVSGEPTATGGTQSGRSSRVVPPVADRLGPVPSRRGPRRSQAVTYRVRVDLRDTKPPLWRRLELSSDIYLDELHEVLQAACGWTDSHLHEFRSGAGYHDLEVERYLCPFMLEEDDDGVPEEQVRGATSP